MDLAKISTPKCGSIRDPLVLHLKMNQLINSFLRTNLMMLKIFLYHFIGYLSRIESPNRARNACPRSVWEVGETSPGIKPKKSPMLQTFSWKGSVLILLLVAILPTVLFAQGTGRINGYLHDKATGEPLPYANVMLKNTRFGAISDVHGYYVLNGIPPRKYKLVVSRMGYEDVEKEIEVQPNGELRFDVEVALEAIRLGEVTVAGKKTRFIEEVEISRTNIGAREIGSTPSLVEADVFRTIQQLPSATSQSDFSSALVVRGGSPDENLILVDGAEIYNPYHLLGLFSTFNADTIANAKFLAGGYPAEYTGRLSSILDITSREGKQVKGKGETSFLSSKVMLEGPFYKGAWILSGRRTYLDLLLGTQSMRSGEDQPFNYHFWDGQIKIFSDLNTENRLTFSTFDGRDVLRFNDDGEGTDDKIDLDFNWGNNAPSLTWRFVPNSKFFSEFVLTRSNFDFDVNLKLTEIDSNGNQNGTNIIVTNQVQNISAAEKLTWYLSPQHTLKMGAALKRGNMGFNFDVDNVKLFDIKLNPYLFSAFIQDRWKVNNLLSLQFGLRSYKVDLDDYKTWLDPRLGFRYLLTENLALKGSWGVFNQFLFTVNDANQILQIVDFWIPVPAGESIKNQHFILGIERWFDQGFTGSIETYYKPYSNVLTLNPNNDPGIELDEFISGTGRVWGLELFLKKTSGKFSGWLGYSYSNIERRFDFNGDGSIEKTENQASEIYAPKYSKPHSLNLVVSYQMNKKNRFSLSWTNSSGQPYTPVIGKVYDGGGALDNPYAGLINIQGRKNSSRYPPYVRGDIAWIRDISLFGVNGKFKFQVINFTYHYNVLLYVWDHDKSPSEVKAFSMLPIVPSFGLEFEF